MYLQSNLKLLVTNQVQFAKNTNIARRTLQEIIYGKVTNPRIDTIMKIASELNISIDDLIYKDFSKETKNNE